MQWTVSFLKKYCCFGNNFSWSFKYYESISTTFDYLQMIAFLLEIKILQKLQSINNILWMIKITSSLAYKLMT